MASFSLFLSLAFPRLVAILAAMASFARFLGWTERLRWLRSLGFGGLPGPWWLRSLGSERAAATTVASFARFFEVRSGALIFFITTFRAKCAHARKRPAPAAFVEGICVCLLAVMIVGLDREAGNRAVPPIDDWGHGRRRSGSHWRNQRASASNPVCRRLCNIAVQVLEVLPGRDTASSMVLFAERESAGTRPPYSDLRSAEVGKNRLRIFVYLTGCSHFAKTLMHLCGNSGFS
jgi:hypothetical protein